MLFSCIRTILFLLFDINCVWYFSASLSLSLSLSLSISLLIAPKKSMSTSSQNPFHFKASSSVDPTPSHVKFHDDKAYKDFSENFSRCSIHLECQVFLSNFSDTVLPTVIHSRSWESLYDIPITCPFVII